MSKLNTMYELMDEEGIHYKQTDTGAIIGNDPYGSMPQLDEPYDEIQLTGDTDNPYVIIEYISEYDQARYLCRSLIGLFNTMFTRWEQGR